MNIDYKKMKKETEKAILFEIVAGVEKWIPKSVIESDVAKLTESRGAVAVADWFAKKNNLGDYESE